MENFIGLDAHSKSCTFVNVNKEGHELGKWKLPTSEANLLAVVRSISGKKSLVFEEGNLSQWLYILLKDEVDKLISCNPVYLGKKQGAKNDYKDALHLANELRCNHVIPVYHDDSELMKMRNLTSAYQDIVKDVAKAKTRYKALLRLNNIKYDGKRLYNDRKLVENCSVSTDNFVADSIFAQISLQEEIKSKYQLIFRENQKKNKTIQNLSTIPGVREVRSNLIAALICTPDRFKNKHHLWSYAMLVRHREDSDGTSYGNKTHQGRRELKSLFMGAAKSALQTKSSLRRYYDRLRSKGKTDKQARKAIARRIAAMCLSIMKHGVKFDDKFLEKQNKKNIN